MDLNGVLNAVFDSVTGQLRTTPVAGPASTATPTTPDENGAWAGAYDSATQSLRVVIV